MGIDALHCKPVLSPQPGNERFFVSLFITQGHRQGIRIFPADCGRHSFDLFPHVAFRGRTISRLDGCGERDASTGLAGLILPSVDGHRRFLLMLLCFTDRPSKANEQDDGYQQTNTKTHQENTFLQHLDSSFVTLTVKVVDSSNTGPAHCII